MARASSRSSSRDRSPPAATRDDAPVYVIFGGDALQRRERLATRLATLGVSRDNAWGLAEYDGGTSETDLATVLDDVRSPALLASRRVVLVRRADDFISANRDKLEDYLAKPSTCGVLILEAESFLRTTRFYKALAALGGAEECVVLSARDLPAWIERRAKSAHQVTIEPNAAELLVDAIGDSLERIDNELAKMAALVSPATTITKAAVEESVTETRLIKVFAIMDHIAARDPRGAIETWHRVLSSDRGGQFWAAAGIASNLRKFVAARYAVQGGQSQFEAMREVGMWGDYATLGRTLMRLSLRKWEELLIRLMKVDHAAKSSGGSADIGIEKFIIEACQG